MLFSQASLLLALTSVAAAAPYTQNEKRDRGSWHDASDAMGSFFNFGRRHSWKGRTNQAQQCNLAAAQMPQAPEPLPAPSEGMVLYHVAIGRGSQNYTCDLTNTTAVPVAVGALASLFNVTCLSADSPTLLSKIPDIALQMPVPTPIDETSPEYRDLSGHHYFTDATTAFFNMDTTLASYGAGAFKKINATDAPADSVNGQSGQGYGSVPWLKLAVKDDQQCPMQEVYRLNTAGGQPPKSCQGQQASFQVEYAAEYWFYS